MSRVMPPSARQAKRDARGVEVPRLEAGDRLDQKTFHARYEAMPPGTRAELVGGIVYMPSPLKLPHGGCHVLLSRWLDQYAEATDGVEAFDNATSILGPDSEPQPDLSLVIAPDRGGQTRAVDDYMVGPPELVVEIASGTESYDLHAKNARLRAGRCEGVRRRGPQAPPGAVVRPPPREAGGRRTRRGRGLPVARLPRPPARPRRPARPRPTPGAGGAGGRARLPRTRRVRREAGRR